MESHNIHHQHQHQHQYQQQQQQMMSVGVDAGDRFPQWSVQETKEFLMIRGELDQSFMETKRNKVLWEVISTKLRDKGFHRSSDQCKCKWKNLVTRYKGCETMEPEAMRQQFPFYNEMQTIFAGRMQRMLWAEAEGGAGPSKKNKPGPGQTMSSDDEEEEESDFEKGTTKKKAKKAKVVGGNTSSTSAANVVSSMNSVKEMLEEFMNKQLQMEVQWKEAYEAKEEERRRVEIEFRQRMEALENERLMMERRWRDREEQRRLREDARAEKRDALINVLLNKLRRDDNTNM